MRSNICIRCGNCGRNNWIEVLFDNDYSFRTVDNKPKCEKCHMEL